MAHKFRKFTKKIEFKILEFGGILGVKNGEIRGFGGINDLKWE